MKKDGEKPLIADGGSALGVRVGLGKSDDLAPDPFGYVKPGLMGMSVAPKWEDLPPHRVPKRLRFRFPWASGSDSCYIWRHGDGPFASGEFANGLVLHVDKTNHGVITPARKMTVLEYREAIRATRDAWTVDEPVP